MKTRFRLVALLACLVLTSGIAAAHPSGNFSINRLASLHSGRDGITILYIIDMAEIPAFQEIQKYGLSPARGHPSLKGWLADKVEQYRNGISLTANGQALRLETRDSTVSFPPGERGLLPTIRIEATFLAPVAAGPGAVEIAFKDGNYLDKKGWKEITVAGSSDAPLGRSTAPSTDCSGQLRAYPKDMLDSPPQELAAQFTYTLNP